MTIATIPEEIRHHLPVHTNKIQMGLDYAKKILIEKKLTYEDIHIVQKAVTDGYCCKGKNKDHLDFLYLNNDGKSWILVIKSAGNGTEVWFCTLFYTTRQKYYIDKFKGQLLLRSHKGVEPDS